jgi:DNA-binding NtrC family response regulator
MKEILIFTDDISKYGVYRSYLETGVSSTSLRATLDEVFQHVAKKPVNVVIVDTEAPCVRKKDVNFLRALVEKDIEVFLIVDEITDECLIACNKHGRVTVIKKPFDTDILVAKLGIGMDLDAAEKDIEEVAACGFDSPFYDAEEDIQCLEENDEKYG